MWCSTRGVRHFALLLLCLLAACSSTQYPLLNPIDYASDPVVFEVVN